MTRRRSLPWIQRYSRVIMGILAVVGALITSYITIKAFSGGTVACPVGATPGVSGCDTVLGSPYAKLFGLPLSLFGLLAYLGMLIFALLPFLSNSEDKRSRNQVEQWTWQLLLIGGTAMAVFSGYLMYIAFFVLKDFCLYCIGSALCSLGLFLMALFGREWEEVGQMVFSCIIVGIVTLVGTLGLYANAGNLVSSGGSGNRTDIPVPTAAAQPPYGWEVTTTSGESEIALAKHLTATGAKEYGAFWCPHCFEQKQLFGKEAFKKVNYLECDPQGVNPQTQACKDAGIKGFPSWEIKGELYSGTQTLDKLAELSGYTGPKDFKYQLPSK